MLLAMLQLGRPITCRLNETVGEFSPAVQLLELVGTRRPLVVNHCHSMRRHIFAVDTSLACVSFALRRLKYVSLIPWYHI